MARRWQRGSIMHAAHYRVRTAVAVAAAATVHFMAAAPAKAVRACSQCVDGTRAVVSASFSCARLEEQICNDARGLTGGTFSCPCGRDESGVCQDVNGRVTHGLCVAYCERLACNEEGGPSVACQQLRRVWERRTTEPFPCEKPVDSPPQCGDPADAQCGGVCGEGTVCAEGTGGDGGCTCVPRLIQCGESQPGMCGGVCPPEMPNCQDFGTECMCWF